MEVRVCKYWDKVKGFCTKGKRCGGPCDQADMENAEIINGKWIKRDEPPKSSLSNPKLEVSDCGTSEGSR